MAALEHMTNDRLRAGLAEIDEHGWDSQAGHTLLTQVRVQLVRPIVARAGLFGKDAAQAEATGWAEAWECLASPYLRTTARPWNVLWTTVRRAVRSEVLATRLVTSDRRAWEMKADADRSPADGSAWQEHRLQRPLSLDVVDEAGQAPPARVESDSLGETLDAFVDVMVTEGWVRDHAWQAVGAIAVNARRDGEGVRDVGGWRQIARDLDLPPWQIRRLTMLVMGTPGWPGVVESAREHGASALDWPSTRSAIRATLSRELLTPTSRPLVPDQPSRSVARQIAS